MEEDGVLLLSLAHRAFGVDTIPHPGDSTDSLGEWCRHGEPAGPTCPGKGRRGLEGDGEVACGDKGCRGGGRGRSSEGVQEQWDEQSAPSHDASSCGRGWSKTPIFSRMAGEIQSAIRVPGKFMKLSQENLISKSS